MVEKSYWQDRLNRRRLLTGAALGGTGLAATAVLGCGGEPKRDTSPAGEAGAQPKRGGILVDARFQILTGRTMDPHKETPTSNRTRRLWYQGLLGYDVATRVLVPEIAARWEQPSETEYIFTLQPGVKWHNKPPVNGRLLTADDVLYSLNRLRTPEPVFVSSSLLDPLEKLEAIDQHRIRMTTKGPNAVFLPVLRSDGTLLLAPEAVEAAGRFATAESVIGTGPFILRTFQDQVGAESVRNPDYWKPGLPYLDGHTYRYFGDEQQAYAAFLANQVDVLEVPGTHTKDYIARLGRTPALAREDSAGLWLMANTRAQPFTDPRVVRAMRLIADYQELRDSHGKFWHADAMYGSVFPSNLQEWDIPQEEYLRGLFWQQPKDPAIKEALDLLNAAGFNRENRLSFELSVQVNSGDQTQATFGELVHAQFRRLSQGILEPTIRVLEGAQATQTRTRRTFTYGLFPVAGAFNDPDAWLTAIFHSRGSRNYTGFSDPQIDAMIDRQRTIFNAAQRTALVQDIVRLLIERSPQALPYTYLTLNGTSERVRGYVPDGGTPHSRQFEQVWFET